MATTYFEDVAEGDVREFGSFTLTEAEIIEFGEKYDPQPFHVDPEAAEDSLYGGLIASGWHTAVSCMRLLVDGFFADAASMGATGMDSLQWHKPVRHGDTIYVSNEIVETRPSESRDDRGYIKNRTVGENEEGDAVISWTATNILARRDG